MPGSVFSWRNHEDVSLHTLSQCLSCLQRREETPLDAPFWAACLWRAGMCFPGCLCSSVCRGGTAPARARPDAFPRRAPAKPGWVERATSTTLRVPQASVRAWDTGFGGKQSPHVQGGTSCTNIREPAELVSLNPFTRSTQTQVSLGLCCCACTAFPCLN